MRKNANINIDHNCFYSDESWSFVCNTCYKKWGDLSQSKKLSTIQKLHSSIL